jgi:hypothetical protein
MKHNDFTWDDIILEAPGDEDLGDDLSATDYADADFSMEEGDPSGEEDMGTEEEPVEGEDVESEDDVLDEDPLAEDEEGTGEEGDDIGGEGDPLDEDPMDDGSGETTDEEQTDNTETDVVSDVQNINLVNDFIELYRRIDEIMNQIRTDCKTNIRYNPNMLVVRQNLTKLKEITYDYITNKFSKESYVSNLYQFNLIIQALNVNIDLLSSVLASNKKAKENNKSKKKTKK